MTLTIKPLSFIHFPMVLYISPWFYTFPHGNSALKRFKTKALIIKFHLFYLSLDEKLIHLIRFIT